VRYDSPHSLYSNPALTAASEEKITAVHQDQPGHQARQEREIARTEVVPFSHSYKRTGIGGEFLG
jgi:hypothetical protein